MSARRVVIRGDVQGVGFRISALRAARARGVTGWVRNRPDGAVEAVYEGGPDALASMLAWSEHGPRGATVETVEVSDEAPGGYRRFEIRS